MSSRVNHSCPPSLVRVAPMRMAWGQARTGGTAAGDLGVEGTVRIARPTLRSTVDSAATYDRFAEVDAQDYTINAVASAPLVEDALYQLRFHLGARGMGAATVRALVQAGHDVTFTVRSSGAAAESLVAELKASHPERDVAVATVDLANKAAVAGFCEELEKGETLYGLVHNAGQPYDQLAAVMDQAKAEEVMQINFFAFTRLVNAVVRPMMRARVPSPLRASA